MENLVRVHFVDRPNRFVVRVQLEDGSQVRAYLPNTGRLDHLTERGRPWMVRRDGGEHRVTEFTAVRAWDGCWVGLEASRTPRLLVDWLAQGNRLSGYGEITTVEREVTIDRHRLDLRLTTRNGTAVWVEVKSGGRAEAGVALLSRTPSARGFSHLETLGQLVAAGEAAAAVFVVQRPDAMAIRVGGDADPGWVDAVRTARAAGVTILAFGCAVSETEVVVDRELEITWEDFGSLEGTNDR